MNRLMLCSGIHKREGWVTLDAQKKHAPDIVATIPPLPPAVKSRKWDAIEWIHGIGSLYPWDGLQVLKELRSVLAPDGILALEQPNALLAAAIVIKTGDVRGLFGDDSRIDPWLMNRWAYTPGSLCAALEIAGFTRARILPVLHHIPERDFRIEAQP